MTDCTCELMKACNVFVLKLLIFTDDGRQGRKELKVSLGNKHNVMTKYKGRGSCALRYLPPDLGPAITECLFLRLGSLNFSDTVYLCVSVILTINISLNIIKGFVIMKKSCFL